MRDNVFCSIAMMSVEIPNRNAVGAFLECIQRRDRDVVEITEAHRLFARGVMSRWPI